MKGALWSVVSAFAVVLQVAADIPVQPNFDIQKLRGKWHSVAAVLDAGRMLNTWSHKARVVPAKNGDVFITNLIPGMLWCTKRDLQLLHTDQPGKFTTEDRSVVRVVETDYDNYYMDYFEMRNDLLKMLTLFTREAEPSDEVKEKFKTVAKSLGFQEDKIIYLSKPDHPCPDSEFGNA